MKVKTKKKTNTGGGIVSVYTHYKTGKKMIAKEYGYGGWPIGRR